MDNNIRRTITTGIPAQQAYTKFVNELNSWWPREYTWSQDQLQEISMDARENGLCSETRLGSYPKMFPRSLQLMVLALEV